MKTAIAALAITLLPGLAAAQAACPTAADLDRGIRVTFADGGTETFRNAASGLVSVAGRESDGLGFEMDLGQGFHLMSWEGTTNGQLDGAALRYDYGVGASDLPRPVAGKGWRSEVTVTDINDVRSEPQTHRYGQISSIVIGDCTYQMMEIVIAYATGDNYVETLRYLPELGISYLVWNEADGMEPDPVEATQIMRAGK
jgi:hypothetical protein